MLAALLLAATNAIAVGAPSVNCVLSVQQSSWTSTWQIGGQTVNCFQHGVKTRTNKTFVGDDWNSMYSRDGYFYFKQNGKRVKYTVKEDGAMYGMTDVMIGDVYLNGKKVGHYNLSGRAGEVSGTMTLNGKKYKMR